MMNMLIIFIVMMILRLYSYVKSIKLQTLSMCNIYMSIKLSKTYASLSLLIIYTVEMKSSMKTLKCAYM